MAGARHSISNNRRRAARESLQRAQTAHRQGRYDEALDLFESTLDADPTLGEALAGMTAILEMARGAAYNSRLAGRIERCLTADSGNFLALSRSAAHQIRLRYGIAAATAVAVDGPLVAAMANDPLVLQMLQKTYNMDSVLEGFLTRLRAALLDTAVERAERLPPLLPLIAALAQQCFNNEFVFWQTPEEPGKAAQLNDVLATAGHGLVGTGAEASLAVLACYEPLYRLTWRQLLLANTEADWHAAVRPLISHTLREPLREEEIKEQLPQFSEIRDATSLAVGGQYEANPYPRWMHLAEQPKVDILQAVRRDFPAAVKPPSPSSPLRVLSAGCGTGQHALSLARGYRNVDVTAIDLSASSLAYAMRKAEELRIRNARFLRGDILDVAGLATRFDLIESIGVLHHMADPASGWRALLGVLKPGGLIRIALYGRHARRDISEARRRIAALGLPDTPDGIRRFRHLLVTDPQLSDLKDIIDWDDFYTTSNVRDLLFHVSEHLFSVAEIRRWIESSGMRFLGFEISAGFARNRAVQRRIQDIYRQENPHDTAFADLAGWQDFETRHPELFEGYCFWSQKP